MFVLLSIADWKAASDVNSGEAPEETGEALDVTTEVVGRVWKTEDVEAAKVMVW